MNKSLVLASLVAAVALAACGKKEEGRLRRRRGRAAPPRLLRPLRPRQRLTPARPRRLRMGSASGAAAAVDAAASAAKN